jgi:hypothetical protein
MENKSSGTSGGIRFTGLLTIVFIVLKLVGVIAWSWWWVLSPIWVSLLVAFLAFLIVTTVALMSRGD